MDSKQIGLSIVTVVVAVGLSYIVAAPSESQVVEVNYQKIAEEVKKVGASPGGEFQGPITVNGAKIHYYSSVFQPGGATTTACTFQTPNATSTLRHAAGTVTTATNTALMYEWGKSAGPDATTTSLGIATVAANAFGTIVASTSDTVIVDNLDDAHVIAPRNWVVLKWGGAALANQIAGRCTVELIEQ